MVLWELYVICRYTFVDIYIDYDIRVVRRVTYSSIKTKSDLTVRKHNRIWHFAPDATCSPINFIVRLTCGEPIQSRGVRRPSLSVSRARFVTAGAIDPNRCTYVQSNSQTKFRSTLILGLAKTENTKCGITPELMAGSSLNVYHRYI
jgi:hypothetical protein